MPRPITSTGKVVWNGDLMSGSGTASLETSQLGSFPTHWKARAEESERGTTSPRGTHRRGTSNLLLHAVFEYARRK